MRDNVDSIYNLSSHMAQILIELHQLLEALTQDSTLRITDIELLNRIQLEMMSKDVVKAVRKIYDLIAKSSILEFLSNLKVVASSASQTPFFTTLLQLIGSSMRMNWIVESKNLLQVREFRNINSDTEEVGSITIQNISKIGLQAVQIWQKVILDWKQGIQTTLEFDQLWHFATWRLLDEVKTISNLTSSKEITLLHHSLKKMTSEFKQDHYYMQNERANHAVAREFVSVFGFPASVPQSLNKNLIKLLGGPFQAQDLQILMFACLNEKKMLEEPINHSHITIASNFIKIIRTCLEQYERQHNVGCLSFRDTSIERHSDKTLKRSEKKSVQAGLLRLLYWFLVQFKPIIGAARFNSKSKLEKDEYFLRDFRQAVEPGFWKLLSFLQHISSHFDLLEKNDEGSPSEKLIVVQCVSIMLFVHNKLKIKQCEGIKSMMEACIINLAPISSEFTYFYFQQGLLTDGDKILAKQQPVSAQLQKKYIQLIRDIVTEGYGLMFASIIEDILGCQDKLKFITKERMKILSETGRDIEKQVTIRAKNIVNKMTWTLVYVFQCCPKTIKYISLTNLYQALKTTQFQGFKDFERCCLFNSKFLLQIYYADNNNYQALMKTFDTCKFSQIEFLLVIMSKMFMADYAEESVKFKDLDRIVERLHEFEKLTTKEEERERIIKIYPAIVKILIGKMKVQQQRQSVQNILKIMINSNDDIENLEEFSQTQDNRNQSKNLRTTIYLFKKLTEITDILDQQFKSSDPPKHAFNIIDWACETVQKVIIQFKPKHEHFCELLSQPNVEQFEGIPGFIEFCKHYIDIKRCYIALKIAVCSTRKTCASRSTKDQSDIIEMEQGERKNFILQTQFKQKEFLTFSIEFYKWALVSKVSAYDELINSSIFDIVECLHKWEGDSDVQKEKYVFLKEVVRMFALKLNGRNKKRLVRLFEDLQLQNTPNDSVDSIMDLFQQLMAVLHQQCIRGGKPFEFIEITSLFVTTSETLFSSTHKHSIPTFDRLTQLFFRQIDFLTSLPPPVEPNIMQGNSQITLIQHRPPQEDEEPIKKRTKKMQLKEKKDRKKDKKADDTD